MSSHHHTTNALLGSINSLLALVNIIVMGRDTHTCPRNTHLSSQHPHLSSQHPHLSSQPHFSLILEHVAALFLLPNNVLKSFLDLNYTPPDQYPMILQPTFPHSYICQPHSSQNLYKCTTRIYFPSSAYRHK